MHPDQQANAERIADTLESAFGREVDVVPGKGQGFRVQLTRRLRVRAAA